MRKARIDSGIVVEILEADPWPTFNASLIWVECGGDVKPGYSWNGEEFLPPEEIKEIPNTVTMRQARLALLQSGLLSMVNEAIETLDGEMGDLARIEWNYSSTVTRDHSLVNLMADEIGLSPEQLDELFILAASL